MASFQLVDVDGGPETTSELGDGGVIEERGFSGSGLNPVIEFQGSEPIDNLLSQYGIEGNAPNGIPKGSKLVEGAYEDGSDMLLINGNPQTTLNLGGLGNRNVEITKAGEVKVEGISFTGTQNLGGTPLQEQPSPTNPSSGAISQDLSRNLDVPPSEPDLTAQSAASITLIDGSQILNAQNVRIYGDLFTAESVSTYIKGDSILSDVTQLRSKPQIFSVGHADSVVIGGTTIKGTSNSTFQITNGAMRIDSRSETPFTLTDSSYVTSTFKGNGTLIIETKSHVTNKDDSFAIEEMAEWIRESIAKIPGNAIIVSDVAPISVQEAWKRNISLYYSEVLNLVTTYPVFEGVPLTYDPSTDTFTPALPLVFTQSPILQGTIVPAKNAAKSGNVLYYDEKTRTITSQYSEEFVPLAYEPVTDRVVPLSVAQIANTISGVMSLPSQIFEETLAKDLLDEVVRIVEPSTSEVSVYTLTDGTLTFEGENGIVGISSEYNETVDAINSTAAIIIDPANGVACVQLMPKSAYHYIDPIIERDFSLYVPKNGAPYALCLKKSASQQLLGYEGIVDFTKKEMDLKNIIHYKRYPLKNNKIADTLTTEVFEGKSNSRAELRYQPPFILLDSLMLHDISTQTTPLIARTKPSNYYSITEENIDGQKKRLVVVNWRLTGNHYTQSIPQSYTTDGNLPKLTLVHNVLIQDNGNTRTTILPPEHGQIATLIE